MIAPLAMIDAVWPILLPALLLRGNPPPPPGTLGLVCSTQAELFTQLSSMGSICCGQLNEACLASSSFPLTCVALECERTVRRVAAACGPLLNGSSVYDEWKSQLDISANICSHEAPPLQIANEYVLTAPRKSTAALTACANASGEPRTLVGYAMPSSSQPAALTLSPAATLSAPPGQAVRVDFTTLWLPPGTTLTISSAKTGREMLSLSGTEVPPNPILGETGDRLHIALSTGGVPADGRGLIALSADLSCQCEEPGSCGPHGHCNTLFGCFCDHGYAGPRCEDSSCVGVQCGPHGKCTPSGGAAQGSCACDEGYSGPACSVVTGPCAGDYITLGDDNSWRRINEPAGTHCDAPNPGFGRGPFSPLGNRWYRFTGQAGNVLPIIPARHGGPATCSTSAGGWLSGYPPYTRQSPPPSYSTPGVYPNLDDGIKDEVVCFDQGGGATCYAHTHVRAVKCPGNGTTDGEFWLWQLPSTAHCCQAYCTTFV